jgi:hypothetical protein
MGIGWGGIDLIKLVKDRDKWKGLVNTVMKLIVFQNMLGNS